MWSDVLGFILAVSLALVSLLMAPLALWYAIHGVDFCWLVSIACLICFGLFLKAAEEFIRAIQHMGG